MTNAFVFPGQGSQSVGMQQELANESELIKAIYVQASEILGTDLWSLAVNGPREALDQTETTQPIMLCAGIAAWRVYEERGGALPAFMAGHSLGEYSALCAAGVFGFDDALKLVRERARLMQSAVPTGTGAMAVVLGLDDNVVVDVCANASTDDDPVEAVNFNAPGQVAIAGTSTGVASAIELAREAGARRAMALPVSVPSHCRLMQPAADEFVAVLEGVEFSAPEVPVINNVDVAVNTDPADIRDALVRQLYRPVRWVEIIQALQAGGVTRLVECGPGKVLTGLARRIDRGLAAQCLDSADVLSDLTGDTGAGE